MKENISHYIYDCTIYEKDRKVLAKDVERIAYGFQHIPDIDLSIMTGNSKGATRATNLDLRSVLASFIKQTGRFTKLNKFKYFIKVYNLLKCFLQSERTST